MDFRYTKNTAMEHCDPRRSRDDSANKSRTRGLSSANKPINGLNCRTQVCVSVLTDVCASKQAERGATNYAETLIAYACV
jgi:hypothetical protein